MRTLGSIASRCQGRLGAAREALDRLHRDEQGGMLEYALVFTVVAVPLMALFDKLFDVISDYFGMIAFYVSWPFI